jgi:hypothetical protein
MAQIDNTTLQQKVALRISLLKRLAQTPVVMETHGGNGRVFDRVYPTVTQGVVFELDPVKAERLAQQRPTWSVYQGKCEQAIEDGLGSHLPCNLIDVDPYGEPWPAIESFFVSERPRAQRLAVAVNDGLRQKLRLQGGWAVRSMRQAVERFGNSRMCEQYLEVCKWQLSRLAERQDYRLTHWTGYHCGSNGDMTHYAAIFERKASPAGKKRAARKRPRK